MRRHFDNILSKFALFLSTFWNKCIGCHLAFSPDNQALAQTVYPVVEKSLQRSN